MHGYLLLGEPISGASSPLYRGTYRPSPIYVDTLPIKSAVNQLWMQETDLMVNENFTNLEDAKRVQEVYADAGLYYDLVEIITEDTKAQHGIFEFMGCDISHISGYSLLSWDLNFELPAPEFFHQRESPVYHPLLLLIQKYFQPRLNVYRLLPTIDVAEAFLEVANAMTAGFGAVWESADYGAFSVTKMYMIRNRDMVFSSASPPNC